MGFSRQEYWNELPFPSPGDPPNPGIEPTSLMSPALAEEFFTTSATWEACKNIEDPEFVNLQSSAYVCIFTSPSNPVSQL